ncbi:hypothetical protein SeMB42_g06442 [Synchytrium endobioticum]|uniref:ATP-dependent RNA helicase n=1 Tax=Synchytrium endobioticum TaxID=286115 RepID=A0A507CHS3_9FUNG|nr:hypothetical protein SeMB42_g06442 [Synchytrium endobioticum]TPX41217.1 hypothetical protein SeLEV6574_g06203 [Synchytrium endobioticum]
MNGEDEGIVLNIANNSALSTHSGTASRSATKLSRILPKGSWKKRRLRAKNILHRSGKARQSNASADKKLETSSSLRPTASTSDPLTPLSRSIKRQKTSHDRKDQSSRSTVKPGKKSVTISSLFTSNPSAPALFGTENDDDKDGPKGQTNTTTPSNGVTASANPTTFEQLGLDPILAKNLSSRYSINTPTRVQKLAIPAITNVDNTKNDVIIKAETGSGKTLAYLLPVIHRLVKCEDQEFQPDRTMGLLTLILVPTRELAHQIYTVLEKVVSYPADVPSKRRHWLVPGILAGGEKKKSEKARLRKGIHILVATPGRLLDHLRTTESFITGGLRFVVLDEADRLMDLGFEKDLTDIFMILDARVSKASTDIRPSIRGWPFSRQTILCSATIGEKVQNLAAKSLKTPIFLDGGRGEGDEIINRVDMVAGRDTNVGSASGNCENGIVHFDDTDGEDEVESPQTSAMDMDLPHNIGHGTNTQKQSKKEVDEVTEENLTIPAQLDQQYVIIPAKLRLVTLIAQLKLLASSKNETFKAIVFMSCKDSVDFHHRILAASPFADDEDDDLSSHSIHSSRKQNLSSSNSKTSEIGLTSSHIPNTLLYKLHGDLPHSSRMAAFNHFQSVTRGILFCTDVAARGLDLPDISTIIQYDAPFDTKEYVHRVGRTARMGQSGRAILYLLPSEAEYVKVLDGLGNRLRMIDGEEILKDALLKPFKKMMKSKSGEEGDSNGINGRKRARSRKVTYEELATDLQMDLERLVESNSEILELAKRAYKSQIRAYATHASSQRHIFHIKLLHLGHVAKCFGLRDAPSDIRIPGSNSSGGRNSRQSGSKSGAAMQRGKKPTKVARPDSVYAITKQKVPMSISSEFGDGGVRELMSRMRLMR